ncbi:protein of unknown function [Natronincola peptidivorans]|uniref:DUF2935 domain-containing protein n=1 Tax=Natronincola peptidivorans TaxID=426128 RepID=A0A1I0GH65_9FIRM|nr:DUF2935 domain-containing protein [Natronincola peptidivorans]SET70232.1 protein of unknown function [Natronincola peptidivorans]
MKEVSFEKVALFEHHFWLQVLGDHARFIFDNLSPSEMKELEKANHFIFVFDKLLAESHKPLTEKELMVLTNQAYRYAHEIRLFKLDLIRQHLTGDIELGLPPTFINHMVNEVEEYLRVLCFLMTKQIPTSTAIHNHLIWLLDAAGHAAGIAGDLDMVEKRLIEKSEVFMEHFEEFYIKAVEMAGYMRTCLEDFPALQRFNLQVEGEIFLFKVFLRELEELELTNKLLGTVPALMLDHMAREECYYLIKLAEASNVSMPDCDPTQPRTED